jgi:hypothetical protein
MGTEENGLTLEGLAYRLEALERENDELQAQPRLLRLPRLLHETVSEFADSVAGDVRRNVRVEVGSSRVN